MAFIVKSWISSLVTSLIRLHFCLSTAYHETGESPPFSPKPATFRTRHGLVDLYMLHGLCVGRKDDRTRKGARDGSRGYSGNPGSTTNPSSRANNPIPMASLAKVTIQNLVRSRNVVAPVVARSFSYRTLKIDPVCRFAPPIMVVARRQQAALGRSVEIVPDPRDRG